MIRPRTSSTTAENPDPLTPRARQCSIEARQLPETLNYATRRNH